MPCKLITNSSKISRKITIPKSMLYPFGTRCRVASLCEGGIEEINDNIINITANETTKTVAQRHRHHRLQSVDISGISIFFNKLLFFCL